MSAKKSTSSYDTKAVEWAYPTSTSATRFGFGNSGCWIVQLVDSTGQRIPHSVSGHADKGEAHKAALARPERWSAHYVQPVSPAFPAIETHGAALVVFHDGHELLSVDFERDGENARERVRWANAEHLSAGNVVGLCIPMAAVLACAAGSPGAAECVQVGE